MDEAWEAEKNCSKCYGTDNAVRDHHSEGDCNIDKGYNDDEDYETEIQIHYKKHEKDEETTSNSTDP